MSAIGQAQAEATKHAQQAGIAHAQATERVCLGRKPSYSRGQLAHVLDLLATDSDVAIAKQVGLDTAIAHGMLTMGLGGGYVTSWVGDPAAVTEYNVRFTAVVPVPNDGVGAEITFSGKVKSVDPETKSVTIALSATSGGKKIFGRAIASAKLA